MAQEGGVALHVADVVSGMCVARCPVVYFVEDVAASCA